MLSVQDNETLTRTGPGTPMGKLFRRFWLPALLPEELPEPDCPPIRFRILGEDLVAFRDSLGKVGFVAQACPHRGASLFFGRNEESGLRCVYHGWKFEITGACVDMPSEPPESNFKSKVRVTAYPAAEYGGIVWIYMGPPEKQPPLPHYDWCVHPLPPRFRAIKWLQESNYTQGLEGNIDTAHIGFLHRSFGRGADGPSTSVSPVLQLMETDFGFVYGGRRERSDGTFNWRITPFVLPAFTSIPNIPWGGGGLFVLPMDDEHSWWWTMGEPHPAYDNRPYIELIPGSFRPLRNKDNDYMIDREMQRTVNYTGMPNNRTQDAAVTESMGPIYDRSKEHLGTSDKAVIFMRRYLIRLARQLEQGIEPPVLSDPSLFRVRPINVTNTEANLEPIWEADHREHLREPALAAATLR